MVYLEPFLGSGAVFLNKNPSAVEIINDLDSNIVNLFQILRDRPEDLRRVIELTPYSREECKNAMESFEHPDPLEMARRYLVRVMQCVGAKSNARGSWRIEPRPYPGGAAKKWCDMPDVIDEAVERLRSKPGNLVQIEHSDALDLIQRLDTPDCLMFLDPPYLRSTRKSGTLYRHEMNIDDHKRMLSLITQSRAKIIISGYESDLYNTELQGWHKDSIMSRTTSTEMATETIWFNYIPQIEQMTCYK